MKAHLSVRPTLRRVDQQIERRFGGEIPNEIIVFKSVGSAVVDINSSIIYNWCMRLTSC
jgi:ornithine cyclodeaminase/alanine dehydrogenase-like protein (mu-crystallin family)